MLQKAETILIYRTGSLGDTIVALPCFHYIARRFPEANRVVLTNLPDTDNAPFLMDVIGPSGLVHDCLPYRVGMDWPGYLELASRIRALDVRRLFYLAPARSLSAVVRDVCFFRMAGVSAISGAPWRRDQRRVITFADGLVEREAERLARNIASRDDEIDLGDPKVWDLRLTPGERDAAGALLQGSPPRRLAINLGGKDRRKDWGSARWAELVSKIDRQGAFDTLVLIGASDDRPQSEIVSRAWSGRVVDLLGRCSPRVAAAALVQSSFFIGHDSGPLHLAAASGVPCVGLFGDLNRPCQWHPFGEHVRIIQDETGIASIDVARVLAAVDLLRARVSEAPQAGSRREPARECS